MNYSLKRQKQIGAFYSPESLAMILVRTMLSLCRTKKQDAPLTILDPATGDSILLRTFSHIANKKTEFKYIGVDIEKKAIRESIASIFPNEYFRFKRANALRPNDMLSPIEGWKSILQDEEYVDMVISNPPWGADLSDSIEPSKYYNLAKGQYDSYDLFVELSINLLKEGGIYGFILPDSIYENQHKGVRRLLLESTEVKYIYRLGEGFFENVNIGVSLIIGCKTTCVDNVVKCIHLSSAERKTAISSLDIDLIVKQNCVEIKQDYMKKCGFAFITDIGVDDMPIINKLEKCAVIGNVVEGTRGVELSKKGLIYQCSVCSYWHPYPSSFRRTTICSKCGNPINVGNITPLTIVHDKETYASVPFIRGEDISRFKTKAVVYIEKGFDGINYKTENVYVGSKILIRKTGVGITAGIDYTGSYTNQVVYIYRKKSSVMSPISNEVILGILCSRVMMYFIIKRYGTNGWRTHPYLTQKMIESLPFPNIKPNSDCSAILDNLTWLVKEIIKKNDSESLIDIDVKIEILVGKLFGLNKEDYIQIFSTIRSVQQMIPFKVLLNFNELDLFKQWDTDILAQKTN